MDTQQIAIIHGLAGRYETGQAELRETLPAPVMELQSKLELSLTDARQILRETLNEDDVIENAVLDYKDYLELTWKLSYVEERLGKIDVPLLPFESIKGVFAYTRSHAFTGLGVLGAAACAYLAVTGFMDGSYLDSALAVVGGGCSAACGVVANGKADPVESADFTFQKWQILRKSKRELIGKKKEITGEIAEYEAFGKCE